MNHAEELRKLSSASAEHIDEHGHHQFDMWQGKACCIMGAPRMVGKEYSYSHILRDVLAHLGYDEPWNDKPGRTKQEVVDALRESSRKITDELLQEVYGPKWSAILDFIVQVDDWGDEDYVRIANAGTEFEYPPEYTQEDERYLRGLAGFLGTVMTSGRASGSRPYKRHFDSYYDHINESQADNGVSD